MQPKDAIGLAYGDSLTASATTRADWETERVVETYEQDGEDGEIEERADVLKTGKYFICSEIPEE